MKTFLFQGDSITDADRIKTNENSLGSGYPNLVAAKLGYRYPGKFQFVNKGVGGERSTHLYARCMKEMIAYKPSYMSILIGVNDVWHGLTDGNGVHPKRYEQIMTMLIEDTIEEFPDLKIAILEPFVLKGTATAWKWEEFDSNVRVLAGIAQEIAQRFDLVFVPLQEKFDALRQIASGNCWLMDGVHPTLAGHEMIANELIESLEL